MKQKSGKLFLVRHGESRWNSCNRFTGWVDIPLSEHGLREAEACAKGCAKYSFSAVYISALERAQETAFIILMRQNRNGILQHEEDPRYKRWIHESNQCGGDDIPIFRTPLLNERYYGKLQGMDKDEARALYGRDKVESWRRAFRNRPPGGETLEEVFNRVYPYFQENIVPRVRRGETVLVSSHNNTLRAIVKELDGISDTDIAYVDFPTAHPIIYEIQRGCFVHVSGEYAFNHPEKHVLERRGVCIPGKPSAMPKNGTNIPKASK